MRPISALLPVIVLALSGCVSQIASHNPAVVAEIKKSCSQQFSESGFDVLSGKMHLSSSAIPTREMLSINETATDEELKAIKLIEELQTSCASQLKEAGYRTTATEDIMHMRLRNLRYGLYTREISYAAYNYGVVEVLKEVAGFQEAQAEAFARGQEIGAQRFAQQMQQNQMNQLNQQLNTYNHNMQMRNITGWTCRPIPGSYGGYSCN